MPHLDAAYRFARWLTRSSGDAEDLVQEAFLRAFRGFEQLRGGDVKAWLLTIVRNCHATALRQRLPIAWLCNGPRVPEDVHSAWQRQVWLVHAARKLRERRGRDEAIEVTANGETLAATSAVNMGGVGKSLAVEFQILAGLEHAGNSSLLPLESGDVYKARFLFRNRVDRVEQERPCYASPLSRMASIVRSLSP